MFARILVISTAATVIVACQRPSSDTPEAQAKIEGPSVKSLSHEQLMSAYAECKKFGRMDDPQVIYTARYCAAVQGARDFEGYAKPAPSKVDPAPVKFH